MYTWLVTSSRSLHGSRSQLKCDGTRAESRFRLSAKRTSPFKFAGGRQFSWLLAAEVCASVVVMLDTQRSEVVWRVLATNAIRQFPLHFPSRASPSAIIGSNARYTMFRGSVKGTGYPLHSPVSPSLPPPVRHRAITFQLGSNVGTPRRGKINLVHSGQRMERTCVACH